MTSSHRSGPAPTAGPGASGHPRVVTPRRRGAALLTAVAVAVVVTGSATAIGPGTGPALPERLTMEPSVVAPEAWGDPRPLPRLVAAREGGPAVARPVSSRPTVAELAAPPVQPAHPVAGGEVRLLRVALATSPVGRDRSALPAVALQAYQAAERRLDADRPDCRLDWPLLAAIGHVESDHGRFGGRTVDRDGHSWPAIIGVALDGTRGTAVVRDTDAGTLDGDPVHDRAVGPMQFIPGTWSRMAVDGDGDGRRDPHDLHDAALAAGVHLCAGGEVASAEGRSRAVFRYNRSAAYVRAVLALARRYAGQPVVVEPDGPAGAPVVTASPRPTTSPLPQVPPDLGPASPGEPQPRGASPAPTAPGALPSGAPQAEPPVAEAPGPVGPEAVPASEPSPATGGPAPDSETPASASPSPTPAAGCGSVGQGPAPSPSPTPVTDPVPSLQPTDAPLDAGGASLDGRGTPPACPSPP